MGILALGNVRLETGNICSRAVLPYIYVYSRLDKLISKKYIFSDISAHIGGVANVP